MRPLPGIRQFEIVRVRHFKSVSSQQQHSTDRLRAILVAEDFFDYILIKTASKRADDPLKFLRAQHILVMVSIIEAAMGLSSVNDSETSQSTRLEIET